MKKTLLTLTVALVTVGLYAQGTVNFATFGGGVNAKARDTVASAAAGSDVYASGTGYLAQLYYGPADAADDALTPLNRAPATFHASGYILASTGGGKVSLDGIASGSQAKIRIFAWEAALGSDAAAAVAAWENGGGVGGWSNPVIVATGGDDLVPPVPPASLIGLQDWDLVLIPEPSTFALGALGGLGLLLLRRRK